MVCFVGSNSNMSIIGGARMGGMGKVLHAVRPKNEHLAVGILQGDYVELDHYGRGSLPEPPEQEAANRSGVATMRGKFPSLDIRSTARKLRRKLPSMRIRVTGGTVSRLARKMPCVGRVYLDGQAGEENYPISGSHGFAMEEGGQGEEVGEFNESGEVHDLMEPPSKTHIRGASGVESVGLEAEVIETFSQESWCCEDEVSCNAPDKTSLRGSRVEVTGSVPNEEDVLSSDNFSKPNENCCNVSPTDGDDSAPSFSLLESKDFNRTKPVTGDDELETLSSSPSSSSPLAGEGSRAPPQPRINNVVNAKNDRMAQTRERTAFLRSYMSKNLPSWQSQANCNEAFDSKSPVTNVHTLSEETRETTVSLSSECHSSNSQCSLEAETASEKYEHEFLHSSFQLKSSAFTSKARIEKSAANYGFKKAILETSPANHLRLSKKCYESCDGAILHESLGIEVHETDSMEDIHVSSGEFSSDWLHFIEEPDEDEWDELVDHYVDSKEFAHSELHKLSPLDSDDDNAQEMLAQVKTLVTRFSVFFVLLTLHFVSMGVVVE